MRRLASVILVAFLLLPPLLVQIGGIGKVNASPSNVYADTTDGYLDSNGFVYSTYPQMSLGDWSNNAYAHCYVKFSLAGISGTLSSATLNLCVYMSYHNNDSYSASPLTNPGLGDCQVIHIADYGTLDTSDFTAASIGNDPGVLLNGTATPNVGYVSIDVRAAMQDDINHGRTWSAFMLRMSTNTDGSNDNDYWVFYTSRDASPDHHPYVAYDFVHQGDLVLTGNNVTTIEGAFSINGSIVVEDNASLILRNAIVNFMEMSRFQFNMTFKDPANGNPRFLVENATISTNNQDLEINLHENSSASINNLTALNVYLYGWDSAVLMISGSTIYDVGGIDYATVDLSNCVLTFEAECRDSSAIEISNCTIWLVQAYSSQRTDLTNSTIEEYIAQATYSANCSVDGLKPGFVAEWDFRQNCSVLVAAGGWATNLTLSDTQVGGWSLEHYGSSNATVSNSELYYVDCGNSAQCYFYDTATELLYTIQNSTAWLVNSTSNVYQIFDQSKVCFCWYLDVHVIDSIGQDVPSAAVLAYYSNSTAAASSSTNGTGWTKQVLTEKIRNATGDYPVGNYTVTAMYSTYSNFTTVNMTQNQQATLELSELIIPELSSSLILPLLMIATLLAAFVLKRKRNVRT